jgi:VWFA-related protein
LVPGIISAQAARPFIAISGVESHTFPEVTAYLAAPDQDGALLAGLSAADFRLTEDGVPVPAEAVTVESGDVIQDLRLVLAIDISLSAEDLAQVQAAAGALLEQLGPRDRVALIVFGDTSSLAYEFTNNKDELQAAIAALTPQGARTALNEAITTAVSMAGQLSTGRRAVIVIADSRDNTGTVLVPDQLFQTARQGKVSIFPIGFGPKAQPQTFTPLVGPSGGRAYVVPASADIQTALLETVELLRQGYKLTFQSGLKADNQDHTVVIEQGGEEAEAPFVATPGPVTVTLTGLAEGQTVRGGVELTVQATAPAPIVSVEYLLDGQSLATSADPPYRFAWNSVEAGPGPHTLTARAIDSAGNEGAAEVRLTVATPLTVEITTGQSEVHLGDQIPVTTRIETSAEIAKVEFLLDGVLLGSHNAPPFSFSLDSSEYPTGTHTITVQVEDSLGQQAEDSFSINFLTPPEPPRPVWPERIARGALLVLAVLLTIIALMLILSLFRLIVAWQKKRLQQRYQLEISNLGNISSPYDLTAKAPGGGLKFQFCLNGSQLPQQEMGAVAAAELATVPLPAAPAYAAAQAGSHPPANGGAGLAGAKQGLDQAVATGSAVGEILSGLSYLLPGSLGAPFRSAADRIFQVQGRVNQVTRTPTIMAKRARQLQSQVAQVVPGSAAPARGSVTTTGSMAPPSSGPAAAGAISSYPAGLAAQNGVETWAETPLIQPGQILKVDLLVAPLKPYQSQEYSFTISSKPAGPAEALLVTEQGQLYIKGIGWFARLIPIMLAAVAIIGILLLAGYGLYWLINANISTWPILGSLIT